MELVLTMKIVDNFVRVLECHKPWFRGQLYNGNQGNTFQNLDVSQHVSPFMEA